MGAAGIEVVSLPLSQPALLNPAASVPRGTVLAVPLLSGQSFAIRASLHFSVAKGTVSVWGAEFPQDTKFHQVVRSPNTACPLVEARYTDKPKHPQACKLCGALCLQSPELCHLARRSDAVVLIRKHVRASPRTLPIAHTHEGALRIPLSWTENVLNPFVKCLSPKCKTIMTAGGTGVGKSTLSLWLANSLLQHAPAVALLDIDPGQPMFGVPGTLSLYLLLEPCMTLQEVASAPLLVKSLFFGHLSPDGAPCAYVDAVVALRDTLQKLEEAHADVTGDTAAVPLVVNTCGWVASTGWQLVDAVGAITQCQHIAVLLPSDAGPSTPPRSLTGIRPTFQRRLVRLGVKLPWFTSFTECPSVAPPFTPGGRGASRAARVLTHLMQFPGELPDIASHVDISMKAVPPFKLAVRMDRVDFRVDTDCAEWKSCGLLQYHIELMFDQALVAVERDGAFVCFALVSSINWRQQSVTLSLPHSVQLPPEPRLKLSLASKLIDDSTLRECRMWAAGLMGPVLKLPGLVPVLPVKKAAKFTGRSRVKGTKILSATRLKKFTRERKK